MALDYYLDTLNTEVGRFELFIYSIKTFMSRAPAQAGVHFTLVHAPGVHV